MQTRQAIAAEIEAAWRYYLFNWVVVGVIGAALALSLFAGNVSLEPTALALAIGYIGLFEGLADGRTRSPSRSEPRATFMLGGTAQIVLIAALLSPLFHGTAAAGVPPTTNLLAVGGALCSGAAETHCADFRAMLDAALHDASMLIHWSMFAIPVLLAANHRLRRVGEFTLALALALIAMAILPAMLPAHDRPALTDLHVASAALCVWALWPLAWLRPFAVAAFGVVLASAPLGGGHAFVGIAGGAAIALLAIVAARGVGWIVARRQAHGAASALAAALPGD